MNICILGYGNVGSRLAHLWASAGHTLSIGLRTESSYGARATQDGFHTAAPQQAASPAEVVILGVPWHAAEDALRSAGPLDGKVIIDATNPLNANLRVTAVEGKSAAHQVAAWCPGAKVVKAFNTIGASEFGNPAFDMYYCTDHEDAALVCHGLIEQTGMRPVHAGPFENAIYLEYLAGLWINLAMTGKQQTPFGFNLVREHGR